MDQRESVSLDEDEDEDEDGELIVVDVVCLGGEGLEVVCGDVMSGSSDDGEWFGDAVGVVVEGVEEEGRSVVLRQARMSIDMVVVAIL